MSLMTDTPIRLIELHEREARVFPRSDLYDQSGSSLLLPETRALSAVELRDVIDGVELRVLGVIGYLPITPNITLHLSPKFPLQNLWSMLAIADENYEKVFPALRGYEISSLSAPHKLLAKSFSHYLKEILTAGVARGYHISQHNGYYKPKVNFGRTIKSYLSRGNEINVSSDYFKFSADLYPNGLLKSACAAFLRIIPTVDKKWSNERRLLLEALSALHFVKPRRMHLGDEAAASDLPIWLKEQYKGALTVYSMLLGYTKIGFSYSSTGSALPSFLFSMDNIFESYIRNYLRSELSRDKVAVYDGNSSKHQAPLFLDNKRFPIKPDLIFKKDGKVIALGEVKYKPKIDEADRYQLISHAVSLNSPVGIWISPAINDGGGLEYVGEIASGTRFYHYRLNISGQIKESVRTMYSDIVNLVVR